MHFTIDNHVISYLVGRIKYNWLEDASTNCQTPVHTYDCVLNFKYDIRHTVCFIFVFFCFFPSFILYSQFYVGSMYDNIRLHVAWSYTSSADSPFSLISSFTLSNHLLLGRPLFLLPCAFITIALLPTQCSSLLITCPYHFNLLYSVLHHRYNKYMHTFVSSENTASVRKQWLIKTNGLCSKTFISY